MSAVRLFVLGALAARGPMHGHQVRLIAEERRQELWTLVRHGSIYSALHRLAAEGAVQVVRTERAGNMPARTIYAITEAGRAELTRYRHQVLRHADLAPDPIDLALNHTDGMDPHELLEIVESRRTELIGQLADRLRIRADCLSQLSPIARITIEHTLTRLRAEISWHGRLLTELRRIHGVDAPPGAEGAAGPTEEPTHGALELSRFSHHRGPTH